MEFIKEAGVSPQKSMDIKNDKITIKPLRDKDVDIFSKWLAKEYIYKWFCPDGEEHKMAWLDEVNNRNTQYHNMKHFIVYYWIVILKKNIYRNITEKLSMRKRQALK